MFCNFSATFDNNMAESKNCLKKLKMSRVDFVEWYFNQTRNVMLIIDLNLIIIYRQYFKQLGEEIDV